jgi:hypothetical protein
MGTSSDVKGCDRFESTASVDLTAIDSHSQINKSLFSWEGWEPQTMKCSGTTSPFNLKESNQKFAGTMVRR